MAGSTNNEAIELKDATDDTTFHETAPLLDDSGGNDNTEVTEENKARKWFLQWEYTWVSAVIYSINYSAVLGFVAIPDTFESAGLVPAILLILWAGILNYISFVYVSNLAVRVESIVKLAIANGIYVVCCMFYVVSVRSIVLRWLS